MKEVTKFFIDAFRQLGSNRGVPAVDVRFYPYAGLRHTIRLRSGQVYVRLSDLCKDCPPEVMRALAFVLVARLLGKKVPEISRVSLSRLLPDARGYALLRHRAPASWTKNDFNLARQHL